MDKYKKLVSNTVIFALGTFGSKLLVFLLMPLYTNVLSDAEYGVVDLLMQAGNLLLPLVSVGINNSIIRFGLDKDYDDKAVFTNALSVLLAGYALFLLCFPLNRWLVGFARSDMMTGRIGLIYVFVICSTLRSFLANFVRSQERVRLFALDGVLSTATTIAFNVLYLVVFKLGILGYMLAVVCADFCSSVFLFLTGRVYRFFDFRQVGKKHLRPMLRYCIPLIPTTIFWWITNVSDRFIVTAMLGEGTNGLYAVSYKIPTLITLVSGIFIDAWQMSAISEANSKERAAFFTRVFSSYRAFIFTAAAGLILMAKPIMHIMVSQAFYPAWRYVPFLIMATTYSCMVSFSGSVYMVERKSGHILWTTLLGAVANVVMNIGLIPRYGANGAAFATFFSYAVVFLLRARNARRYIPVQWGTGRLLVNTALLLLQTLFLISDTSLEVQFFLCLAMILLNFRDLIAALRHILGKYLKGLKKRKT